MASIFWSVHVCILAGGKRGEGKEKSYSFCRMAQLGSLVITSAHLPLANEKYRQNLRHVATASCREAEKYGFYWVAKCSPKSSLLLEGEDSLGLSFQTLLPKSRTHCAPFQKRQPSVNFRAQNLWLIDIQSRNL